METVTTPVAPMLNINKGITLTQPVIGRITMGHTVIRPEGKTLPVKDDHFGLTTLVQDKATRAWEEHALQKKVLGDKKGNAKDNAKDKLRAIPVRIAYNDPNLTLHNSYSAWDAQKGRILCCGNGVKARRLTEDGVKDIDCPRPEACEFGVRQRCKNMSRAYFQVEGQEDELGVFILRTTSFNSLNYLGTRLAQLTGLTGGRLAGMPMMLVMETKTTTQSFREPIQFADLVTRPGMKLITAIQQANEYQKAMADAGLSLEGMEIALRAGLANSDFADEIEDMDEWISDDALIAAVGEQQSARKSGLKGMDDLTEKLAALNTQKVVEGSGEPPAMAEQQPEGSGSEACVSTEGAPVGSGQETRDPAEGTPEGSGQEAAGPGDGVALQQDLLAA